jgi:hypothetical protein
MTEQIIFKCPDPKCGCSFFTRSDVNKHLAKFGESHAQALKEMHQNIDNRYNAMEFSEADKTIADFEKIIKQYCNIPERRYK